MLTDLSQEGLDKIYADLPLYMENIVDKTLDDAAAQMEQLETYNMEDMQFNRHNLNRIVSLMSEIYYNISIRTAAYRRSLQTSVKTYLYYFEYSGNEAKLIPRPNQHLEGNLEV